MIKVIASDMDGTLVSAKAGILPSTTVAIQAAQQKGVKFLVSTGRVFEEAVGQLTEAGISCDILCMNGAELRDSTGKIEYQLDIKSSTVKEVCHILEAHHLYIELYTSKGIFSPSSENTIVQAVQTKLQFFSPDLDDQEARKQVFRHHEYTKLQRMPLEQLLLAEITIFKILSFSSDTHLIQSLREQLDDNPNFSISGSFAINLEITNAFANKGLAVKNYAQKHCTSKSEVMVLGDSFNDFSMFTQGFGYPIAMGNAIDELKKAARSVTDDNNHDGVGKAIKKYVLKGEV